MTTIYDLDQEITIYAAYTKGLKPPGSPFNLKLNLKEIHPLSKMIEMESKYIRRKENESYKLKEQRRNDHQKGGFRSRKRDKRFEEREFPNKWMPRYDNKVNQASIQVGCDSSKGKV